MTVSRSSGDETQRVRFEAVIRPGPAAAAEEEVTLAAVDDFDLDRIPDPEGGVRLLIDLDEVTRLVEAGFEVRLQRALAPQPLDQALIADDDTARAWLEERIRPVRDQAAEGGEP